MNISKAKLEELFVEELARLQPTVGLMRLVSDRAIHAWRELKDRCGSEPGFGRQKDLVDRARLELATSALRRQRSPS